MNTSEPAYNDCYAQSNPDVAFYVLTGICGWKQYILKER